MSLLNVAAQLFLNNLGSQGSNLGESNVVSALTNLLPTNSQGDLDLGSILSMFQGSSGLASLAASWLGDGGNSPISAGQIMEMFGQSKVQGFANELNLDENAASTGLSNMIPDLIDQNSKGGSLMDSDMMGSLAKGVLGSLFK